MTICSTSPNKQPKNTPLSVTTSALLKMCAKHRRWHDKLSWLINTVDDTQREAECVSVFLLSCVDCSVLTQSDDQPITSSVYFPSLNEVRWMRFCPLRKTILCFSARFFGGGGLCFCFCCWMSTALSISSVRWAGAYIYLARGDAEGFPDESPAEPDLGLNAPFVTALLHTGRNGRERIGGFSPSKLPEKMREKQI